jgi:drug/metabolite transporter (DMT)-like permease
MVAMKGIIPLTSPFFLAGVRLLPAGILVLLAALWMGRPQPKTWQAWLWIGAFALIDGTLFQGFLAQGLTRTGAGLGSVMIDSQPLAVALMARFLFGEQVGPLGWIGLAFGLLGISLLGIPDEWLAALAAGKAEWLSSDALWQGLLQRGEWLMLLAALSMAVGTVMIRYVSRHADPIVATGWHMVLGGLPLFALSALGESQQWQALGWTEWSAIAYATILGSAIAYGIFFWLAAQGNLTSLSALTFLTPVFALVFGNLFLGEVLTPLQWAGVGFTLISIYFINQRSVLLSNLKQLWLSIGKQTSPSDTPS